VTQIVSLPTPKQPMPILDTALLAHRSGLCVVPLQEDGSKRPIGGWAEYQRRMATEDEIRRWDARGLTGIGIVCGEVSGRLEMLEFEGRAVAEGLWQEFKAAAEQTGLRDLLERIKLGYGERTPSRGFHLLYRCPEGVEGNTELARRLPTEEEAADDERAGKRPAPRVLIETRGESGYVIVAPSSVRVPGPITRDDHAADLTSVMMARSCSRWTLATEGGKL
jgi:putative DNA primase/helicase